MTTKKYAKEYLYREIREIENNIDLNAIPDLTVYEKAIIFKYSEDGYEDLNEKLRLSKGRDISDFGILLNECLSKLPDYQGIVYRGDEISKLEFDKYVLCYENVIPYHEFSFFSTSKSKSKAYERCKGRGYRILFKILSKKGKDIERFSKYKTDREVLLQINSIFNVDLIEKVERETNFYRITLTEQ